MITHTKTKDLWLFIAIITGVFMVMLFMISSSAVCNDGLWHMAMGRYMVKHQRIPTYAIGAWGGEHLAWVAQEWFYQVLLYLLCHNHMKIAYFLTYGVFFIVFLYIGILHQFHEHLLTRLVGFGVFLSMIILMLFAFLQPRPQAISMMLLVLYLVRFKRFLFVDRIHYAHLGFFLILGVFWANLHAGTAILGYLIPIGLLFGYFLSDKLKWIQDKFDVTHPEDIHNRLSLVGLVMLLAVFCTPHGIKGFWYPIESMNDSLMLLMIQEWRSPNFNDVSGLLLFWLPFLGIILWLILEKSKKIKYDDILILALFLFLTLQHIRMAIYLFAVIALIIPKYCVSNRPVKLTVHPIICKIITGLFVLIIVLTMHSMDFQSEGLANPAFFHQVKEYAGKRPYNDYDLGSIMQYDQIPVFVDARYDPFAKQRMHDIYRLQTLDSTSDELQFIMDKYDFTSIIDIRDSNVVLWAKQHGFHQQAEWDTGVVTKNQVGDKTDRVYELWIKDN